MRLFNIFKSRDTFDSMKKRVEDVEKSLLKFSDSFNKIHSIIPTVSAKMTEIDKTLSLLNEKIRSLDTKHLDNKNQDNKSSKNNDNKQAPK